MATALDLGNVGLTGVTSGPHAHWTVTKGGQLFPLSKARKDLGQYIEFRPPGEQSWRRLYSDEKSGFKFNPTGFQGLTISSPMGTRQTGIPGATTNHRGEDYTFPEGTSLRFLGPGSVATYSGQGSGGNVSSLRTGPYELETMHLGRLPGSATTRKSDATATTTSSPDGEAWARAYIENQVQNQTQQGQLIDALISVLNEKEKPKTLMEQMKEGLIGGMMQQVLTPKNFLSQFTGDDPYLQGKRYATNQFFGL